MSRSARPIIAEPERLDSASWGPFLGAGSASSTRMRAPVMSTSVTRRKSRINAEVGRMSSASACASSWSAVPKNIAPSSSIIAMRPSFSASSCITRGLRMRRERTVLPRRLLRTMDRLMRTRKKPIAITRPAITATTMSATIARTATTSDTARSMLAEKAPAKQRVERCHEREAQGAGEDGGKQLRELRMAGQVEERRRYGERDLIERGCGSENGPETGGESRGVKRVVDGGPHGETRQHRRHLRCDALRVPQGEPGGQRHHDAQWPNLAQVPEHLSEGYVMVEAQLVSGLVHREKRGRGDREPRQDRQRQ